MFETRKLIKITLKGLKEDFSWIEIKCSNKNKHYLHTINYIDNKYTINYKNANFREVKKTLKKAIKINDYVNLIKMK
ncbi:hypothetical protein [Clostridium estertheticum]|uniref:Uncharacterized protein n=1 Tax=Clostridium estertheticum TaxID=238834 RepID=A0A7Y3SZR4_9CLOT|nr:hypothetical protein [Clostridium estertheticum]NNU78381.1 hypothetical protein [Clostridium estertheticum]WBL45266.1 hypothetical protein LOR37_11175 [Clostridium estertheticum]